MAPVKLTEAFLKKLTSVDPDNPEAGPKPSRFVADTERRGLMVNVTKAGTKTFHVRWTDESGKSQRIAIPGGTWPDMRVEVARERASDLLHDVRSKGRNLKAEKQAKRAGVAHDGSLTVSDLIDAWDRLHLAMKRPDYRRNATTTLRSDLAAYLAAPATDLTRKAVVSLSEQLQTAGKRGAARNMIAYGSAMYGWALKTGRVEANPFLGVPRPAAAMPDRVLTDDEIGAVYAAAALRPYPSGPFAQLLMLTGMRRDEVAEMEWSELDAELIVWTVPGSRMKNHKRHVVHLSEPARTLLRKIRDGAARYPGSKFVFTTTGKTAFSGFSNAKEAVDAISGVSAWRWHDLRHTIATRMVGLGVHPHVADKVLAHTMPGIMGRYQHAEYEAERRSALDIWAAHVLTCADNAVQAVAERTESAKQNRSARWSKRLKEARAVQRNRGHHNRSVSA
ncbi:tyrosine-type recombinase/integrase [Methylobacterium sp. R2-1]|uniref:tyrosine-type recombinase/integrase n=1 Tax=Methylobacterium sp. R2-1 TaxID=2587064 RepID=UPI001617F141|nr:site-specific integrase [Methylobacterium sp. R2-1]MBB2961816.1 integrase [Methylobacterium sp. R2-1]